MELYINGYGLLSAAGSSNDEHFLKEKPGYNTDQLFCKEPDYTAYIPPMQLRRMSKAVRMGIGASKLCLSKAGIEKPRAISVGTAMGCLQDTEVFLAKMISQEEQMLTPTAFIQSTHNTVAGQIALVNGCHGHNLTYVQRGHSLEHAFINAALYLQEHDDENMLVGGIDELIDASKTIMQRAGVYSKIAATQDDVMSNTLSGSIAGEGASFFAISKNAKHEYDLCIRDIFTFTANNAREALQKTDAFVSGLPVAKEEIDAVLLGISGDKAYADSYKLIAGHVFANTSQVIFKQLCGDYGTAVGFALGMACHAVSKGFPRHCLVNDAPKRIKHIIIINNFQEYYSCWHLTA